MSDETADIAEPTKLYSEILAAIRTTDDTSFKLLGLVPLVSGLANSGLAILGKNGFDPISIVLLSAIGASVTYCLSDGNSETSRAADIGGRSSR